MITFFNKLANSWVAKVILGILALSMMAFWGLGGLTNLSSYNNEAISIGKTSVSTAELNQAFDEERKNLSRALGGRYISPAEALNFGLLQKVIQDEIVKHVKYQIKEDLGLTASNEAVQKYVETNPLFKDATGNFDKNLFYAFLTQKGMSETSLAYQLKDELAYNHLKDTLQALTYSSKELTKLAHVFSNEKRDIKALFMKPSDIQITETASQEDLKNYYEGYSENFAKPEYRSIKLLTLTPDMMSDFIKIDEAEINTLFEEQKDKYNKPEERELLQIFFKNEDEATKSFSELTAQNFEEKALTLGQTKEATYFGYTPKNQLMEALQEPVFSAKKGDITKPIASETGYHIFYIKDIKEAEIADANTVKEEIKKSLIANLAYDKLTDISRQVEDSLGAGTSLTETAKTLNLKVVDVEPLDMSGLNQKGEKNTLVSSDLLQEIFILKTGETTALIQHNNGYLIAELTKIDPVGVKPFEEVKDDVDALFKSEKQKEKFEEFANNIHQKIQKGSSLEQIAQETNTKLVDEKALSRSTENPLLKPHVNTLFALDTGIENANLVIAPNQEGAVILVVQAVHKPTTVDSKDASLFATQVREEQATAEILNNAVFNDYMQKLDVKVNQKAVGQIMSLYQGQE
ncbi:MAG: SurA N-terminal domain-containing protein [Alphaproteobacteria bacterium]|nr:SurA N-terminal domain-containing protein [Alphaproteobacteria bacterium]